jgi:hypothetical protein
MSNEITEILLRKHDEIAQEVVGIKTSLASVHTTLGHISDTLKGIKDDNLTTRAEVDRLKTDNNRLKGGFAVIGGIFVTMSAFVLELFKQKT